MNGKCLEELFAAHFRGERAIAAARRFILRNSNVSLRRSDVVEFLRHRRDRLSEAEVEYLTAPQPTGLTVLDWNSVDGSPNLIGRLTVQFSNRLIVPDKLLGGGAA
jgi:hypothetical protein